MPTYEAGGFEPLAPVVRATVRGSNGTVCLDVPLLIDTGADVSVIPLDIANTVQTELAPSHVPIRFLDGDEVNWLQAELTVEFLRYRFHGQFLVTECEHGVLGRNLLNLLLVTLDGPSLTWSA